MIKKGVIAGRQCYGKSTLIKNFKTAVFPVIAKIAREVLEERKDYEKTPAEILYTQRLIAARQYEAEAKAEREMNNKFLFLDRGAIDNFAYCSLLLNYVPKDIEALAKSFDYCRVFVPDLRPFVRDNVRAEQGQEEALSIHSQIIQPYQDAGHAIITVLILPEKERFRHILKRISEWRNQNGLH